MSSEISDIHAFALSRRLFLPFTSLTTTLASTLLQEIISNASTSLPEISPDQADSLIIDGWGEWEGISGQRWEIARDDIVQMKKLRRVPDSAAMDERLSIQEFELSEYLSDEFVLSRRHLWDTASNPSTISLLGETGDYRQAILSLASKENRIEDDAAMDRLEEMPSVDTALGLKLEATRSEMEFMKNSAMDNKKATKRVPLDQIFAGEQYTPMTLVSRPELPSIGSPPIFARPAHSEALLSAINDAVEKVATTHQELSKMNSKFSSPPNDRLTMTQWNQFESIEPFSTPVRYSQPTRIWSSSPASTPPSDGITVTTGPEKPIFPRAEMENNVLDEFTRFPPLVSAFPDEDIDELASSDDEHKGGSALTKDLNRLGTSMNMSDWNMGQFEPSLEDSSQSKKGLLSDSRIEIPQLSPLLQTIIPFPTSLSEFALDTPSIWSLKRPSGLRTLTIELDWQPLRVEVNESPHEIFFRREDLDGIEVERLRVSLTERVEDEGEVIMGEALDWDGEEEEEAAIPRNPISIDGSSPSPSPPTPPVDVEQIVVDDEHIKCSPISFPQPPVEPNFIATKVNQAQLPSSSPGFIYPTASCPSSPQTTGTNSPEPILDLPQLESIALTSPIVPASDPLSKKTIRSVQPLTDHSRAVVNSWSTSNALSTFLASRNHTRQIAAPPVRQVPPTEPAIYKPPQRTETRIRPDLPFVTPKFLSSFNPPPSSPTPVRIIASSELIQLPLLYQSLLAHGIILIDRPERPFNIPQPHLVLDGTTSIYFFKLIKIVNSTARSSLLGKIKDLSRGHDRILLILSENDTPVGSTMKAYAFTKPVVESLSLLAKGLEEFREGCEVEVVFSESSMDAARLARGFIDHFRGEVVDEMGMWDDRAWITDGPSEEELSLLQLEGLNSVTICYILSRCTFDQFVAFSKDERQQALGRICGISRLDEISDEVERRVKVDQEEIQSQLASIPTSSSPNAIQLEEVFSWERYET